MTLTNVGLVEHLGADGPRLGVFVVDVGGEPRAMVGPVASGYEAATPIAERLDDECALSFAEKRAAWRQGFAVAARPEPPLGLEGRVVHCRQSGEWRVAVRADRAVGPVRITLLDHHADPLTEPLAVTTDQTWKAYVFRLPAEVAGARHGVEAMHVHVDGAPDGWDYFTTPSVYQFGDEQLPQSLPVRPSGVGAFSVGVGRGKPAGSVW